MATTTESPSRIERGKAAATGFMSGFVMPARAMETLFASRGVKRWALLPLFVNFVVYSLVVALLFWLIYQWDPRVGDWDFWGGFGAWLSSAINWSIGALKWIILVPVILAVCYFTFTTVGMLVATPFNDILSEKTENALCHPKEADSMPLRFEAKAMWFSIVDSVVILLRQVFWSLVAAPLLLIPVVGFVPFFLVTSYFSGLGFVDTAMGRNYLRNRHKALILKERWWQVFGLGLAMELLFLVPLIGLMMLPLGVVAGTLIYCQYDWDRALAERGLEKPEGFRPPRIAVRRSASQSGVSDDRVVSTQ